MHVGVLSGRHIVSPTSLQIANEGSPYMDVPAAPPNPDAFANPTTSEEPLDVVGHRQQVY